MTTPNDLYKETIKPLCGSCLHYSSTAHPDIYDEKGNKSTCEKIDRLPTSPACPKFNPDPFALMGRNRTKLSTVSWLIKMINKTPETHLNSLALMLIYEKKTRRSGFKMGEEVFIKVFEGSGDFASNYGRGIVLRADNKQVYILGINSYNTAVVPIRSVIKKSAWKKKLQVMVNKKQLVDPQWDKMFYHQPPKVTENYTPPSIDEVEKERKPYRK